jgi:hypothetical protein
VLWVRCPRLLELWIGRGAFGGALSCNCFHWD